MNTHIPDHVDIGGAAQPLLMVKNLIKHSALKKDLLGKGGGVVRAVDGIDLAPTALCQRPGRAESN